MLKVVGKEAAQDGVDGRSLLDEIAREGARRMLVAALETEVAAYLEAHRDERDADGHALVVRNGRGRTRKVTVGSGTIPVSAPRVNDRRTDQDGDRRRFTSRILPPYMRRSPKVAEVLPVLYLRGLSTGDFRAALPVLLGKDAAGLSPTTITRLTAEWAHEYTAWRTRSLTDRDYVYVWVDGVHFTIRLEEDRLCTLVIIGVRPDGTKELIAVEDGYRESTESWQTVLRDLKERGLAAPVVAVGDGALGFWAAVRDVWPETQAQRCWVHRLVNVLDKLPQRLQPQAKRALHEIMNAGHARPRRARDHGVQRGVRGQVPEGRRVADARPGTAPHLLRLPGRALEAPADDERDRAPVRDRAAAAARDEGRGVAHEGALDGLQAPRHGAGAVASPRRRASAAARTRRHRLRRWRPTGREGQQAGGEGGVILADPARSRRGRGAVRIPRRNPPPVPSRQRSSPVGRIFFDGSEIHEVTAGRRRAKTRRVAVFLMRSDRGVSRVKSVYSKLSSSFFASFKSRVAKPSVNQA
jgi:transposase-like protein